MEIFAFLKRLHDACIRLSEHLVFDKKHPRHLHLVGLYGSLIELTGSLITLIEEKRRTGVSPIFRSFLETFVEFVNLHADAKYGYHMDVSYHKQWLKVLREAKNGSNPFLKDIAAANNLDEKIREHEEALRGLERMGYKPLYVFDRFEKAGMVSEYRSLYNFLSSDAHSNIRALIDRHIEVHANDFTVVYYKDEPLEDFLPKLDSTASSLVDASSKIHQYFGTTSQNEFHRLSRELSDIRTRYPRKEKEKS